MSIYTDKASRTLKLQKAEKPKIGHGLPPSMDGFEGENRIQMVNGKPRLYYRTNNAWYFTGLSQDGTTPDIPTATSTRLGLIKIGSGGTVSSDGTYTATAATPAADDITGGDAAVTISTSSGNITIDAAANNSNIIFKGTDDTSDITMLTLSGADAGAATFNNKVVATELDISGNADIDGTLEADAITVDGTALATFIRDTVGTNMVSSNTETGISVTYDTSNDNLDFAIAAAQTTITSIYATDLIMGEDSQTAIDFGTANEIDFKADNAARLTLTASALYPVTNNQIDLGTSSLQFKDAFFDGTVTSDAFAGPLTGDVTGTSSKVTVSNSTANTNFPIVFHDESNSLLDDTGALRYNPSTGTLLVAKATISGLSEQASEATSLMINGSNVVGWRELGTAAFAGTGDFMASDASVNLATGVTNTLAVGNGGTGATTLNNLITLSTHTTGNYVATLTAGNLIDLQNNSGEGATPTIDVDLTEASEAVIANGDYILFLDGGATGTTKKEALADLASLLAGGSLSASNSVLSVDSGDFMAADANINVGTQATGTLAVGNGGTGATSLTSNKVLTGNGTSAITAEGNLEFDGDDLTLSNAGSPIIRTKDTTNNAIAYMQAGDSVGVIGTESNHTLYIRTNDITRITIDTSGNTQITGNVRGEADVIAYYSSDPSLKENKELINNPLDKISKIGGYSFDWKDEAKNKVGDHLVGKDYGVMADEIQSLFPELVSTRSNGIRAVKYDKLVPLLIEGIKELKQQLDTIK